MSEHANLSFLLFAINKEQNVFVWNQFELALKKYQDMPLYLRAFARLQLICLCLAPSKTDLLYPKSIL